MNRRRLVLTVLALLALGTIAGCSDKKTNPLPPPAAPRGLFSVTGDHEVTLVWLANTETDLSGYRIYEAPCSAGTDCPYTQIGAVTPSGEAYQTYTVTGLTNGETRYYAVAAVDRHGMVSALSYNDVFDTPRPAGTGLVLNNAFIRPAVPQVGYDFSAFARTDVTGPPTDIFFGAYEDSTGVYQQIFVPDYGTDIQDAGYAGANEGPLGNDPFDVLSYAPDSGWAINGTVEAIVGHNYVVWTRDNHFAKFRVTAVNGGEVTMDWAYQVAAGNPELRARRAVDLEGGTRLRPVVWLRKK